MMKSAWLFIGSLVFFLAACAPQPGETVITRPDERRAVFEAREELVLGAVAQVFRERNLGTNVRIDERKRTVETDPVVQDDWRTKGLARAKALNWKETEVTLIVVTEKKTGSGWEMRRLLDEEQYDRILNRIELKIYQEMYKR